MSLPGPGSLPYADPKYGLGEGREGGRGARANCPFVHPVLTRLPVCGTVELGKTRLSLSIYVVSDTLFYTRQAFCQTIMSRTHLTRGYC